MLRMNLARLVISLAAFTVGVAGAMGLNAAASAGGADKSVPVITSDKDRAEQEAGYDIVTPGNMPPGMVLRAYIVDGNRRQGMSDAVDQYWQSSIEGGAGQWISIMQGPRAAGLLNGEPANVSGLKGQRVKYESVDGRSYPMVELMWPHEGGFLYVSGSIVGTQTEETLRQVAASLTSR